jgi:hypothetical protein
MADPWPPNVKKTLIRLGHMGAFFRTELAVELAEFSDGMMTAIR